MANNPNVKEFISGDVWIREDLSRAYDANSIRPNLVAVADTEFPLKLPAGTPFNASRLVTPAASLSASIHFLVNSEVWELAEKSFPHAVAVFANGIGIVVDKNSLPTEDIAATPVAYDMGVFQTTLVGLGFVVRDEPLTVSGPQVA